MAEALAFQLDPGPIVVWLENQRWYASKSRTVTRVEIEQCVAVADSPSLLLALIGADFATGGRELYQLPLAILSPAQAGDRAAVTTTVAGVAVDAVADPELVRELLRQIDGQASIDTDDGRLRFRRPARGGELALDGAARPMGVEQSNSSVVFGSETVLKVFRRLEPGINPELEVLRFLTGRGFANIAPLQGWYEYEGRSFAATLGVAQRFFAEAVGGWELALDQIRSDPKGLLIELGSLGTVTAQLHNALASDPDDPAFSSQPSSPEAMALLTQTIDADVERTFARLTDTDERVAAIAGRGRELRDQITSAAVRDVGGRSIRTHGDYHLGQTLHGAGGHGWLIIDFEGEPARSLDERRGKTSPLRDVAGMLRSFAYAASSVGALGDGSAFEDRARETFLEHYFSAIEPVLLPAEETAISNLLSIFELEKAVYELRYELDNRPDWLPIPVAGIARLLES
ncbi:MAG: maltokinase N-terminal cap-like domain-containing protein [Solirubrobacteraceae bacterium]